MTAPFNSNNRTPYTSADSVHLTAAGGIYLARRMVAALNSWAFS